MVKYSMIALGVVAALVGGAARLPLPPAQAAQFADGTVVFTTPPRLVEAVTTRALVSDTRAIYYFTLNLPAGAEEPLQKLEIRLAEGRANLLRFRLQDTEAFEGDRHSQGALLSLGDQQADPNIQTVTITFDPPVPPGRAVTVALHPERNPRFEGTYLFGVTAYPEGDLGQPSFCGYGRLAFFSRDGNPLLTP